MPVILALTAAILASSAEEPKLVVGSLAPPLKVEKWIQGEPFKLKNSGTYVVEFWATWCGPCIASMPHISDLADKYKGKVEFIGVNIADRRVTGEETPNSEAHVKRITEWVAQNKEKMRYNVVLDDAANTMMKTWMTPAGQNGIPCAFLISKGKIQWIGHPQALDAELIKVTAAPN